jgi:hypothetical protein
MGGVNELDMESYLTKKCSKYWERYMEWGKSQLFGFFLSLFHQTLHSKTMLARVERMLSGDPPSFGGTAAAFRLTRVTRVAQLWTPRLLATDRITLYSTNKSLRYEQRSFKNRYQRFRSGFRISSVYCSTCQAAPTKRLDRKHYGRRNHSY